VAEPAGPAPMTITRFMLVLLPGIEENGEDTPGLHEEGLMNAPRVHRATPLVLAGSIALIVSTLAIGADYRDVPEWPDSNVGRLAEELLEIINTADRERAVEFIAEHYDPEAWKDFPAEDNAAWLCDLKEAHGNLAFHYTRRYDSPPGGAAPGEFVVAILYSQNKEQWMGLSLQLGHEEPGKVRGMVIMPARAPAEAASSAPGLSREGLVAELGDYLKRMSEADRFSGAVLVARNGEVWFEGAYGLASRRFDVPNRTDTRFNLGSMNKMITAVAAARLIEQGKLRYDDTLDKRLPEGWLKPEVAGKIRIEQLMTHTSGLGDYLGDDRFWDGSRLNFKKLEAFKPLFQDLTPEFEPGSEWAYSNSGFLLLGVIVEQVAGQNYEVFVEQQIYRPAGMTDTRLYEMDLPVPNLAIGYYRDTDGDGKLHNNTLLHAAKGGPAGGGYSTVRDLLAFAEALRGDELLSAAARQKLWETTDLSRKRLPYGRGFIVGGGEGDLRVGHGGSFPGISANLEIHVDSGWTVVVLCNLTGGIGAGDVTNKINEWLVRLE